MNCWDPRLFCGTLVVVSMDIEMKNMQKEPVEGGDSSKSF